MKALDFLNAIATGDATAVSALPALLRGRDPGSVSIILGGLEDMLSRLNYTETLYALRCIMDGRNED